jgi:hypothetical protein
MDPVYYAMLSDKTNKSYFTMVYMLKLFMEDNKKTFNIESMRMDFDVAHMKADFAAWKILVKGCYNHVTQAGCRIVQNNNMASSYLNDDFKCFIKCVFAFNDVQDAFA